MNALIRLVRLAAIFAFSAMLAVGCGGGDGGDVAQPTGSVALLMTDGPTDKVCAIYLSVTRVELLGGPERVTIFEGDVTFDLRKLEDASQLFVIAEDVPKGHYSKIRFTLRDLELVECDGDGNAINRFHPNLPGNHKLDLNDHGGFFVAQGKTLVVELDWDAGKSILIVSTGSGKYQFRPVVFVNVISDHFPGRLARLSGIIQDLDLEASSFRLCRSHIVTLSSDDGDDHDRDRGSCVGVIIQDDTSVFAPMGTPVSPDQLADGEPATVIGRVRIVDHDGDRPLRLLIAAEVIELGPRGTYTPLRGLAQATVDDMHQFPLELAPGQGFAEGSVIPVELAPDGAVPGTKIFSRRGRELGPAAIQAGIRTLVDGIIELDPNLVKAALLILAINPDSDRRLSGTILDVSDDGGQIIFSPDGGTGDICVNTDADTDAFLISESNDSASSEMVSINDDLEGLRADIYGDDGIGGCVEADTIIAFAGAMAAPL